MLVKPESMEGTGFLGAHASEVYRLEADDLYLVGTSEVPLAAYHSGEILTLDAAAAFCGLVVVLPAGGRLVRQGHPRASCACTSSTRSRCSSYCRPEDAAAEHQRLLAWEEEMLAKVDIPYRVIDVAAGDLGIIGGPQVRLRGVGAVAGPLPRGDLDVELHDVPGRRLNIRYRDADGKPQTAATLNGTLATTRWLIPILENHQQPDGSVRVPKALQPYLGGRDVLEPVTVR